MTHTNRPIVPDAAPFMIIIRHWANNEGRTAAALGYTGPNPYTKKGNANAQWRKGYLTKIEEHLDAQDSALPQAGAA